MKVEYMGRIKQLRDKLKNEDLTSDEIRIYSIQIETLLPKPTKTLFIDADGLIFKAAYSPNNKSLEPIIGGTFVGVSNSEDGLIDSFNAVVNTVVEACKLESIKGNMTMFKDYKLVFTPSTNFRYDLFPDYKIKRKDKVRSNEEVVLKKHIKDNNVGLYVNNVEADDVVAYYARRGNPIASGDKDVIFGVAGNNFFYHNAHMKVYKTTKEFAQRFVLLQTLAGDSVDDIPGLKGVGLTVKDGSVSGNSCKLLGDSLEFNTVVSAYINKGLTLKDAILTRRLVGLDQWRGLRRNKIKLFDYKG